MKNVLRISVLVLIALFMLPGDADAQRYGKKKKKKKKKKKTEQKSENSINFQDRLWYGAGGSLNFFDVPGQSQFTIGLFPMVGYKFNNWLSAGPRVEAAYTNIRIAAFDSNTGNFRTVRTNQFDFGGGAFARAKSPFGIYLHTEYLIRNDQCLTDFNGDCQVENPTSWAGARLDDDDRNLETKRLIRDSYYIGLGYNSSGFSKIGYEFQINYDLLLPDDVITSPFEIRAGLTYNF